MDQIDAENDKKVKRARFQNKIRAAGRMALILKNLRSGSDSVLTMSKVGTHDGKIDNKKLLDSQPKINYPAKQFRVASQLDAENEKHPSRRGSIK